MPDINKSGNSREMKTKHLVWWVIGGILLVAILGFAYYAISPLFRTIVVNEEAPAAFGPKTADAAEVVGTVGHPGSGFARIVRTEGTAYVRYENLKTINGPDLYVYLSKDLDAKEHISLGRLKATEGNVNYEIPAGIDPAEYRYVLIWCRMFGVLFNSADLSLSIQ